MEQLISAQEEMSGRIARTLDNLRKVGTAKTTVALVQSTLNLLDKKWKQFEEQHSKLRTEHWEQLKSHEYLKINFLAQVEEIYIQQRAGLLEIEEGLKPKAAALATTASGVQQTRVSLPRIHLPSFSGDFNEWPSFRDVFTSMVGKDTTISEVEKLHYLRSSVKGSADQLIRNLPLTSENYDRAWTMLVDQYENKRLLVRSYLSMFTALPKMRSESAAELKRVYHGMLSTTGSLEGIGRPITDCTDLFIHLVVDLMDAKTRREWELSLGGETDPPTYETLRDFLANRLQALEALPHSKVDIMPSKSEACSRTARAHHVKTHEVAASRCPLCAKNHYILFCGDYKSRTAADRKAQVNKHNLCLNCLGKHAVSACSSKKSCTVCGQRHHTSLHGAWVPSDLNRAAESTMSSLVTHRASVGSAVLLATARVWVTDHFGTRVQARALIDLGSETSLITETCVQKLHLRRTSACISIVGVGGSSSGIARGRVEVKVISREGDFFMEVPALVLPRVTTYGDRRPSAAGSWAHLAGLALADPDYDAPGPIDLLLGADVFGFIVLEGVRRGDPGEPFALNTSLGWIVAGATGCQGVEEAALSLQCSRDEELSTLVRRFWEQEEPMHDTGPLSVEEQRCMDHFAATHARRADGRYVVRLPFARKIPDLRDTRWAALRMLQATESRFLKDPVFKAQYCEFLREYESLGHMTMVSSRSPLRDGCFLPHHGVLRRTETTTKLRVVFNGSQRTRAGLSLNNYLLTGPNLLPRLADILLRWRRYKFAFVADVEKMYRQILVHEEDRHLQTILWRKGNDVREFLLNTVTYGLASAPFLAIRTLQQLADDEGGRYPLGAAVLRDDVYVDDILTGAFFLSDARQTRKQTEEICAAGGFPLKKWAANDSSVLDGVPEEHRAIRTTMTLQARESHTTLGVEWRTREDNFSFIVRPFKEGATTRRGVLSQAAQLFDPLGWIAPVVVKAKCIIQSTWLKHIGWDDRLPEEDAVAWEALRDELPLLHDLRVPRWIGVEALDQCVELHGFADASERAYAAVLYLKTGADGGKVTTSLLQAKTRVAPLKQLSVPRLELCAASLLAAIASHAIKTLGLRFSAVHLWTDSMVTLGWIRGHPGRWTTFVANRVAEIQRALPEALWHHIPGETNPADCASRGLSPGELLHHDLWWRGPSFLTSGQLPSSVDVDACDLPEARKTVHAVEVRGEESELLTRHSSFTKLLRVSAWMRRWRRKRDLNKASGTLALEELHHEEVFWIKHVQSVAYSAEMRALDHKQPLSGRSSLLKLAPFKDEDGILRVGGRLKHAMLSYDERHPVILPPESHLSQLIVDAFHRRTLHGGVQLTLANIRRRYWLLRGRQIVRRHLLRCPACVRWRAASPQPRMSNLPATRTALCRPFLRTGVDYAGPFHVRAARGRGHKAFKAFVAIFVCFSTRAAHLEIVSDYSTEAFLAAFKRFTARRGVCQEVFSDCGTNFVGADAQLRAMFRATSSTASHVADKLLNQGTRWRFNPPGAPHFGGLWEAAVKSAKHHLRRVVGNATLTFEEMSTLLAMVEACLNSRPLQALSDDPDDVSALTPGHFLIGEPLCSLPEPSLEDVPAGRLNRWQLVQQMRDHLWRRWSQEYLTSLTTRSKWHQDAAAPRVGQLCLVKSELTPPSRWPLARVEEVHAGDGNQVRVATVRTASSTLTRPLVKLVPLPGALDEDER